MTVSKEVLKFILQWVGSGDTLIESIWVGDVYVWAGSSLSLSGRA